MAVGQWVQIQLILPKQWTCGHCGLAVAGDRGYYLHSGNGHKGHPPQHPHNQPGHVLPGDMVTEAFRRILICPQCDRPTYFEGSMQVPGAAYGNAISHLPPNVETLYSEARNCMSVSAFTASVLATRKLLMNVAVSQGAKENRSFQEYVKYLSDEGYVPKNAKGWVDHIRDKGNEATHEIPAISESDAKDLLTFMEMLLKMIFEYPGKIQTPAVTSGS